MKDIFNLTDRELEVLNLFNRGKSIKEIGVKLKISLRTVEVHSRNFRAKINDAKNVRSAMYTARKYGLITD